MAHNETGYIQLPPDSTGKKSAAIGRLILDFSGENPPNILNVEDTITGDISGATGVIVGISRIGFAIGEGQLFLDLDSVTGTFVANEAIKIGPTTLATIKATSPLDEIYYQKNVMVDRDAPDRSLTIDDRGAANVTFTDGQPSLSSFGGLVVNEPTSVRHYTYSYDGLDQLFYLESSGAGNVSYAPNERSVIFDTGSTASGDFVRRTSHFYHPYQPGTAMRIMQSIVCGDDGKANVVRRWGYYDDENGLFWELDGTDLSVVMRSNATGSVVDTKVTQDNFNSDKLDGSVNFEIDVAKANLYWIEFQWLGVGTVSFGVYEDDGTKSSAHTFRNPNSLTTPYMRQGTLPIRYECGNTDTAASSSELKSICAVVSNIGQTKNQLVSRTASSSVNKSITAADGEVPILAMRSALSYNGLMNRAVSLLESISVYNSDSKNILLKMRRGAIPSGAAWDSTVPGSDFVELDEAASGLFFGGNEVWSGFVPSGQVVEHEFLNTSELYQDDMGVVVLADGVTQPALVITAEVLSGDNSELRATMNWKEVVQ